MFWVLKIKIVLAPALKDFTTYSGYDIFTVTTL
jgi:hypothetical protein